MGLKPGDVLDGRYVIERLLGQGGMGAVYVAREDALGRRVAVKVLLPDAAGHAEAIARFEREARSAAALESPHVTRIFAVGRDGNGAPYIAMELLDGEDLADALSKRGPLPVHDVVRVIIDACDALSEAHGRGIIHRDLKPANLFFARRSNGSQTIKVLDFGISKATGAGAPMTALTGTSAMMGTPYYMAPEQIREARDVDGRADVWALGVTMYELLAGVLPFRAENLADLCVAVMLNAHVPLIQRRPEVGPALDAIVNRCLMKDREARFGSASELANALGGLRGPGATTGSGVAPTMFDATPMPRPHVQSAEQRPAPRPMTVDPISQTAAKWSAPKSSPVALIAGGGLAALTLGVVAVVILVRGSTKGGGAESGGIDAGIVATVDAAPLATTPSSIAPLPSVTPLPPPRPHTPARVPSARPAASSAPTPASAPNPRPSPPPKPVTLPAGPPPIPDSRQ